MGKTLLILRHGKSDWNANGEDDFDRPLARRGRDAAANMGHYLSDGELTPDVVYTSPARRALSTAELVQAELTDVDIIEDERIYDASLATLLEVVGDLPDDYDAVLLIGHNPTLEELADELTGRSDTVLKTCSLAILRCDAESWKELGPGECELVDVVHTAAVEA